MRGSLRLTSQLVACGGVDNDDSTSSSSSSTGDDSSDSSDTQSISFNTALSSTSLTSGDAASITISYEGTLTSSINVTVSESNGLLTFDNDNHTCAFSSNTHSCTLNVTASSTDDTQTSTLSFTSNDTADEISFSPQNISFTVTSSDSGGSSGTQSITFNTALSSTSLTSGESATITINYEGTLTSSTNVTVSESDGLLTFDSDNHTCVFSSSTNSCTLNVTASSTDDTTQTGTISFTSDDTTDDIAFSPSSISFTVNAGTETEHLLIGYWANLGPWTLEETADQGFNMLIIAFGNIDNDDGVSLDAFGPNFTSDVMIQDIQSAKAAHPDLSVLISFGGSNNTYFVDDDLTDDQINTLAGKLNDFLEEYDLDGVDFDIEGKYSYSVLHTLIADLQNYRTDAGETPYIITAAPQLNTDSNGNALMVSTGYETEPYYASTDDTSALADFDYVMVQEYNTVFSPALSYNDQSLYANDFETISSSFNLLKQQLPSDSSTKLVIGEPASYHSASAASIFYDYSASQNTYTQRDLDTVISGVISQVSQIKDDDRFGGIMEWDTYDDEVYNDPAYGFSQGIMSCVLYSECED
ncbi:glycoside hydrolase family 18 protein [uncultured Shewanella sp.]|uniref:glycoside hydrolase family 18 protein n=1 Tax=uncultured Shewanella sp. TaxID=173975 RepID=UPI002632A5DC|nr:glycoside hydrolase family 18 protein [uncultured Shewanella sp.]